MPSLPLPEIRLLGDFVMKPGSGLAERIIPDYELLYFPQATESVYRVGGAAHTLRQPCFILTRPGERHRYLYDPHRPTEHLFVHFRWREPVKEASPMLLAGGPSVMPYEGEFLVSLFKRLLIIAHTDPAGLQRRGSLLLLTLLEEIRAMAEDGPPIGESLRLPLQIEQAMLRIDAAVPGPIGVEELAREVGWTPEHLSRSFVRHLGLTTKEAITRRRIDLACHLLLHTEKSVKEIAFETGFADPNYFCRVFKSTLAVTASEYRHRNYHPRYVDLAFDAGGTSLPYPLNRVFFGENTQEESPWARA
jgi:AraC-like DNA-binding protein